jgi:5-methylcytosine-specific restriction endonuclease McrA
MASKASRWNEDDNPLSSFHGGTQKAALRAIKEATVRTGPCPVAAKERKDRVRQKALIGLKEKGVRLLSCDVAAPFLPDWALHAAPVTAKSGITPAHVKVWDRCGGLCHYCGDPMMRMPNERKSFTLDHVVPRSRGGSNHLGNLVGSCAECNQDKGSLTGEEYAAVLTVRRSKQGAR